MSLGGPEGLDWCLVDTVPPSRRLERSLRAPQPPQGPFYVQGEFDDGNGLWYFSGVSH